MPSSKSCLTFVKVTWSAERPAPARAVFLVASSEILADADELTLEADDDAAELLDETRLDE